ncbi:hypothetical protein P7K49_014879 [Saguinus oedipus]|uniref:Uncharacterized protein n=1 Tax=Saguinus oedipus TaxID=9490 RepID=A0ABQ9V7Q1_SAGOE|nr:hypothetical protein P7K49_014879 [Saguinus oedipus]
MDGKEHKAEEGRRLENSERSKQAEENVGDEAKGESDSPGPLPGVALAHSGGEGEEEQDERWNPTGKLLDPPRTEKAVSRTRRPSLADGATQATCPPASGPADGRHRQESGRKSRECPVISMLWDSAIHTPHSPGQPPAMAP